MTRAALVVVVIVALVGFTAAAVFGPGTSSPLLFLLVVGVVAAAVGATAGSDRVAGSVAGVLAVYAVLVSPLVDRVVLQPSAEFQRKVFGLPVPFVDAEPTLTPPRPVSVRWNPWEHPADVDGARFLLAAAVAAALAGSVALLVRQATSSRDRSAAPSD